MAVPKLCDLIAQILQRQLAGERDPVAPQLGARGPDVNYDPARYYGATLWPRRVVLQPAAAWASGIGWVLAHGPFSSLIVLCPGSQFVSFEKNASWQLALHRSPHGRSRVTLSRIAERHAVLG